jgi:hypothetical protein
MSYGANIAEGFRQVGIYARPGEAGDKTESGRVFCRNEKDRIVAVAAITATRQSCAAALATTTPSTAAGRA